MKRLKVRIKLVAKERKPEGYTVMEAKEKVCFPTKGNLGMVSMSFFSKLSYKFTW